MKNILKQYKIHPSKSHGQSFLTNKGVVEKIIKAAELSKKDTVLEIGPGLGILTEQLLENAGKVIAVEKDRALYDFLQEKFEDADNLELINKDILTYKLQPTNYKLIANIPYSITGQIFRKFLSAENRPQMLVVMVQKEVGEKLLGKKGRSMLTLTAELYGKAEKICDVKAGSFFPKPKVDSMVVKLTIGFRKPNSQNEQGILRIAKIGFSSKRKKLISNLSTGLKIDKQKLQNIFKKAGVSENSRAEELSKDDWLKLAKSIHKM